MTELVATQHLATFYSNPFENKNISYIKNMTIDKSFDDKSLPVVSATEPVSPQNALDRCLTCYAFTLSKIEASLL